MFGKFFKSGSISPARQVWDAMESGDPALVRRAFIRFPDELANAEPVTGCHFHNACARGNIAIVESLVDAGADINLQDNRDGVAPIAKACANGRIQVVEFLLSRGCKLDVSTNLRNPLFSCISSSLYRNATFATQAGYHDVNEAIDNLVQSARLLIENGVDLTACYIQDSMVDMDAAAFAYMMGREEIAKDIVAALYGHDERLTAAAWAETIEVALGNTFSRQKFRKLRYPSKRGKSADQLPATGEFWV